MNPIRRQRLILIIGMLMGLSLAALLAILALKESLNLFYTPTQALEDATPLETTIRVGGIIVTGSIVKSADHKIKFDITDKHQQMTIHYQGFLPDLFKEESGIICLGQFNRQKIFHATQLLAKHSADYMPKEIEKAIKKLHQNAPVSNDAKK